MSLKFKNYMKYCLSCLAIYLKVAACHLFRTLDVIFCLCFVVLVACTAVNAVAVIVVGDINAAL